MEKSSFYEKYASLILESALGIKEGDVLSINTEEDDYAFARLIAGKAKLITGNGSYIQKVKNGRIVDEFDINSDFPLRKKPTLFLYLSYYRVKGEVDTERIYEPRELQMFSLLSDPVENTRAALPFVTCLLPSPEWDERIMERDDEKTSIELLKSIHGFEREDYLEWSMRRNRNLIYRTKVLNDKNLTGGRIYSDEGTDLSFSFLPSSNFVSSYLKTTSGRYFSPYIFSSDVFRLLDKNSLSGWLNITKPVVLWGKVIRNLSLYFEDGIVRGVKGNSYSEALFSLYASQDGNAARASMLTIVENTEPLYEEEVTHIPEYDRMRTVSITLGGPKSEAVNEESIGASVDSLLTLSLPVGSESLTITCIDGDGEEITVFSDGELNI